MSVIWFNNSERGNDLAKFIQLCVGAGLGLRLAKIMITADIGQVLAMCLSLG